MRFLKAVAITASLCSSVLSQSWVASPYTDPVSGITYSSVTMPNGVSYRVALPINSASADSIVQIVAPNTFGWCGFSWGGRMVNNPLTVAWASGSSTGQKVTVSSRFATRYAPPTAYPSAYHSYLPSSPTVANSTHWTLTARCQGCTRWGTTNIETASSVTFAYACSDTKPTTPASNTSSFSVHGSPGTWSHNLNIARNANFAAWVAGA